MCFTYTPKRIYFFVVYQNSYFLMKPSLKRIVFKFSFNIRSKNNIGFGGNLRLFNVRGDGLL